MKRILITISFFLLFGGIVSAQNKQYQVVKYRIVDRDTLPFARLSPVEIFDFRVFKNKREARQNTRLIRNVKKVYPWAKLAGAKLLEYETVLSSVEKEQEKRRIMKQVEQEIEEEYGGELRKLTFSQGKILIKLIDRETGNSSYDLVEDFRGSFMAFFYQSFARLFGYNLKIKYDPENEDRNIEVIVRMIESGVI
ncbi:MAG: DUF4294 domain-containing protein [Bacteroidales bacterium]